MAKNEILMKKSNKKSKIKKGTCYKLMCFYGTHSQIMPNKNVLLETKKSMLFFVISQRTKSKREINAFLNEKSRVIG